MWNICGCYTYNSESRKRTYLPQVKLDIHTRILSTASRTVLSQSFANLSRNPLEEIRYAFPLFDGVSIVEFCCRIGERTIFGLVKEKNEAKKTYEEAKERGENAALLEQLPEAADVFTTAISNIPGDAMVNITVKYIQELRHDAEVDGLRLTIPTTIAPRYGAYPGILRESFGNVSPGGISITVDISMAEGVPIKKIASPSHPIEVTLGSLSTSSIDADHSIGRGSATLALGTAELEKDFILQVVAKDVGLPQAILETHPTLPNQRALMTTLVPKFSLKSQRPVIIFLADRSGSMRGHIPTLVSALKVFLKSIPVGCWFNICSFGSRHEFLWKEHQIYEEDTLAEAISYLERFSADFGGTETLKAVQACFDVSFVDYPTEIMLLTDGDIWDQKSLFDYVSAGTESGYVRVFPIGIGGGVSSALIEGVARAGRGFAQMVTDDEKLDSKIVRMLKGALTPHIDDYRLEVKYEDETVETVAESLRVNLGISDASINAEGYAHTEAHPISFYDPEVKEEHPKKDEAKDIFAGLPVLERPTLLQTPCQIPPLFPFNRTCVYLLMAPASSHLNPKTVVLRGTSPQGPLELEIPVELREEKDEMIHQLAARKATQELEEGHGWISKAITGDTGASIREKNPPQYALLQRREAVRLGVEFQVGGKYCSFVAVEANSAEITKKRQNALQALMNRDMSEDEDWEMIEEGKYRHVLYLLRKTDPVVLGQVRQAPTQHSTQTMGVGARTMAPRRQLASKAAPNSGGARSAPSGVDDHASISVGKGLGQGGQFRHRKVMPPGAQAQYCVRAPSRRSASIGQAFEAAAAEEPETLLHRLIAHQCFSGSWSNLPKQLCNEMNIDTDAATKAVVRLVDDKIAPDQVLAKQILVTAVVVRFLEKRMADEEETWELVVDKARVWLEGEVDEKGLRRVWEMAGGVMGV
ncbi:von willebrand domain-containing protein [Stemphylium lycopersici]|nr:von willebrand domain-containing protein [Stemphylium lycopersici]